MHGKPDGSIPIREKLGVVKTLGLLGGECAIGILRKRRDAAVELIVLEHVVVVGQEKRCRSPTSALTPSAVEVHA